ncbi:MAG: flagellar biosynthetic protein FliR [Myxococcota bacterium]
MVLGLEDGRVLSLGALTAARVAPLTVVAPWLMVRDAPALVRSGVILALTVAFAPLAFASAPATLQVPFVVALVREGLIGTCFAFATALPFYAFDFAGRLVDTWRGAGLAEVIAPPTGERTSPLGDLQLLAAVALFATLGGHRLALLAFAEGLTIAPVGATPLAGGTASVALGAAALSGAALAFAAAVAAPAAAAIVLVEASLGLVARATPQIPVFFAGMPLRAAAGLLGALLAAAALGDTLAPALAEGLRTATDWLRAFAR